MLINTLTNVNKWYLIVKCYRFIIQIDVFGTQNEIQTETLSYHLISYMKKVTDWHIIINMIWPDFTGVRY